LLPILTIKSLQIIVHPHREYKRMEKKLVC